jgi:hypothetical protein
MNVSEMFPEATKALKNRDRELLAISECTQAAADLLIHNWNSMRHRQGDAMQVTLTYTVTLIGKQNKVKTKLAYSERHTDEREVTTDDPEQGNLPLDGDRKMRERTTAPNPPVVDIEALPSAREQRLLPAPQKLLAAPPVEKPKRKRKKKQD